MSNVQKLLKFCNDNVVLISGGIIIVGVHWTWWRLQNVPALVRPDEKKDHPLVAVAKNLLGIVEDKYDIKEPKST